VVVVVVMSGVRRNASVSVKHIWGSNRLGV
jgi:hypothetical protein